MHWLPRGRFASHPSATISVYTATLLIVPSRVLDGVLDGASSISAKGAFMIRKLKSGQYRLYSRKKDVSTGKRRNLGTFSTMEQAKQHEREVQYFKKH
jgi:hypothetical protein